MRASYFNGAVEQPVRFYWFDGTDETAFTSLEPMPFGYANTTEMLASDEIFVTHRGGSADWPEGSFYAYTQSVAWGAPALEFSIGRSSDGVLFQLHDQYLDRTSLGVSTTTLDQNAMTWAQIQTYTINQFGKSKPYVKLSDVLDAYFDTHLFFLDPKWVWVNGFMNDFWTLLSHYPNYQDKVVIKFTGPGTGVATDAHNHGCIAWGYYFNTPSDLASIPSTGHFWDLLGMEVASNGVANPTAWSTVLAVGKPVLGHICATKAMVDGAMGAGAAGVMVSGVMEALVLQGPKVLEPITTVAGFDCIGAVHGVSSVAIGSVTAKHVLTGAVAGTSAVTGAASPLSGSAGNVAGTSAVTGAVNAKHVLTGDVDGTSVVSGSAAPAGVNFLTGTGNLTNYGTGNTLTDSNVVTVPTNAAIGDVLVVVLSSQLSDSTFSTSASGWTFAFNTTTSTRTYGIAWYAITNSTALSALTSTVDFQYVDAGAPRCNATMFRVTGADLTAPIQDASVASMTQTTTTVSTTTYTATSGLGAVVMAAITQFASPANLTVSWDNSLVALPDSYTTNTTGTLSGLHIGWKQQTSTSVPSITGTASKTAAAALVGIRFTIKKA